MIRKPRRPFPASTVGHFKPGVGLCITRANIAIEQGHRVKNGQEPATPEQIVRRFLALKKDCPTPQRHLGRAIRLMAKETM